MKLMTLNTHSLIEENYGVKLKMFAEGVLAERPDIVALQEVNQTIAAPLAEEGLQAGYVPAQQSIPLRADNHAAHVARLLREAGVDCSWTYLPIKVGYGKYDEGLAILSLGRKITHVESFLISRSEEYSRWKTRKVLGVQVEGLIDWFYTVHMGWWEDEQEPFLTQWKVLNAFLTSKPRHAPVWLMGDFNSPAELRGEGYDKIAASGWYDTYMLAAVKDGGMSMPGAIDGWQNRLPDTAEKGMRIDHIWCSMPVRILTSCVVFNGEKLPAVSDHYAVMVETESQDTEKADVIEPSWADYEADAEEEDG